jgi:hypothetical protein
MRVARAAAIMPFERAAEQVSAQGAIRLGKRQAEELAVTLDGAEAVLRLRALIGNGDYPDDYRTYHLTQESYATTTVSTTSPRTRLNHLKHSQHYNPGGARIVIPLKEAHP